MQQNYVREDEIDLNVFFRTIWDKIFFILVFTFIVTLSGVLYTFIYNPIPIYQGKLLIEIGELRTDSGFRLIDRPNNLQYILEKELKIKILIPRNSNNLIEILVKNTNKEKIEEKINIAYKKLEQRENKKFKMYDKFIPTKKIGEINIGKKPINLPNKKFIIIGSFVVGFILSIFLVFFMKFINNLKKEEMK